MTGLQAAVRRSSTEMISEMISFYKRARHHYGSSSSSCALIGTEHLPLAITGERTQHGRETNTDNLRGRQKGRRRIETGTRMPAKMGKNKVK